MEISACEGGGGVEGGGIRKLMESVRIVAWPGLSKSIDSLGCQIAC